MAMLNIPSHNADPNYRYRMPKLISKVEGRGNGIKTNIMNMAEIARALKRPPEYPTKFCGTELGAQSKFDTAEGKSIVNGAHEPRDLQQLIDKFVDKYVLCPNCQLPEIDLVIKKGIVGCHCNACGHNGDLDNSHKLVTFMIRNPPKATDTTLGKTKAKLEKREKKKAKGLADDDEAVLDGDEKPKKKKKEKSGKSKKKRAVLDVDGNEEGDADGGGEDESESGGGDGGDENGQVGTKGSTEERGHTAGEKCSAKKGKKAKKSKAAPVLFKETLSYNSPEIADVKERMLALMTRGTTSPSGPASSTAVASPPGVVSTENFFAEMRKLQVSQDFDNMMRLFVALDVLVTPTFKSAASAESSAENLDCLDDKADEKRIIITTDMFSDKMPFISTVIDTSIDTARVCVVLEDFLSLRGKQPESIDNFPFILHQLHQAGLVDEDVLIERYRERPSDGAAEAGKRGKKSKSAKSKATTCLPVNKEAAKAVQPFIEWLQEGEEDEDSPSEDENGEAASTSTGQQRLGGAIASVASSSYSSTTSPTSGNTDSVAKQCDAGKGKPTEDEEDKEDNQDDADDVDLDIDAI